MTTTTRPVETGSAATGRTRRSRRHPGIATVFAGLVGFVLTAVGAGIGFRHATKAGLTWIAVFGLTAFVVGVALLGYAVASAWRSTSRWQRLWFVPIVPIALVLLLSLAEGAMLAVAPRESLGTGTPADRGLSYTDVAFRTTDGVRLSAWYIASTNLAAVVTLPGSGSNRSATLGQAAVLARHGYGVLMVDPRGQGRSGGHAMDAGWYGDRDIEAAVRFLQRRPDVDDARIGVLGLSMGGEEAIGAAAADPAIRAVVAEGATHRTAADKAGYLPGGVAGALQRGLDRLTYGTAALLSPAPQPDTLHKAIALARQAQFLLIAAGKGVDEPEAAAYLQTAAPARVRTWTVAGAAHVGGLATAPTEWTARVTSFLDGALAVGAR